MVRTVFIFYMKSLRSWFFRLYWRGGFFKHVFMRLIALWIVNAVLFLVIANIVPGIEVRDFGTALWMALLWGCISITIRPILLLLTLPVTILTLGLFTFVVNGFLFWLLSYMVSGFRVASFGAALFGAFLFSFFGWAFGRVSRKSGDS